MTLEHEVAEERLVVVEEVLADRVALVAKAQYELVMPPGGVVAHDLPEDRSAADGIIGLGIRCVSSPMRTPSPPQKMTTFMVSLTLRAAEERRQVRRG